MGLVPVAMASSPWHGAAVGWLALWAMGPRDLGVPVRGLPTSYRTASCAGRRPGKPARENKSVLGVSAVGMPRTAAADSSWKDSCCQSSAAALEKSTHCDARAVLTRAEDLHCFAPMQGRCALADVYHISIAAMTWHTCTARSLRRRAWLGFTSRRFFSSLAAGAIREQYDALVSRGAIRRDESQRKCASVLDETLSAVVAHSEAYAGWLRSYRRWQTAKERLLASRTSERLEAYTKEALRQERGTEWPIQSWLQSLWPGPGGASPPAAERARREAMRRIEREVDEGAGAPPTMPAAPLGVYVHGPVGTGKSMLMDLFCATLRRSQAPCRVLRVHFNAAMLELNSLMHGVEAGSLYGAMDTGDAARDSTATGADKGARGVGHGAKAAKLAVLAARRRVQQQTRAARQSDSLATLGAANAEVVRAASHWLLYGSPHAPIDEVDDLDEESAESDGAKQRGSGPAVLCFDEVQVTDPYTAVVLKGLFEALMDEGGVLVCTSNRAPDELPRQGLHEDLFSHFVSHVRRHCREVLTTGVDYRRVLADEAIDIGEGDRESKSLAPGRFFCPLDETASQAMDREWGDAVAREGTGAQAAALDVPVMFGRTLRAERRVGGVARFSFAELCDRALGAADYVALAGAFHTVFVDGVPGFSMQTRDRARRFITLIDELYNARVRLVCSAAAPPDELFGRTVADWDEPLVDLEQLQFEAAVEGARSRRDVGQSGGVAPVGAGARGAASLTRSLGGEEEAFAFRRAVSRLLEMSSPSYVRGFSRK